MRILVVDDEPDFREMLTEWLVRQRHRPSPLDDESGIFRTLETSHYDAVILDLMMPQLNGLSVIPRIRQLCPKIGVIVLSAVVDVRVAIEAARAGADACLSKPINFQLLAQKLTRLERMTESRSAAAALPVC